MARWYVVQTLSGQEMKARDSLLNRREAEDMLGLIEDVVVPVEQVTEVKQGQKTTTSRKFMPGYILINTQLYNSDRELDDQVWSYIKETPGVIGFLSDRPQPLPEEEVQGVFDQMHRGEEAAKPKIEFDIGEVVKISDGPFENIEGKIEDIDPDRGKLKLSVSIFGRTTLVEVEYWQVEKTE